MPRYLTQCPVIFCQITGHGHVSRDSRSRHARAVVVTSQPNPTIMSLLMQHWVLNARFLQVSLKQMGHCKSPVSKEKRKEKKRKEKKRKEHVTPT
eukprot:2926907-Rhodomonas_salina.1